jgi:hypothetical protein
MLPFRSECIQQHEKTDTQSRRQQTSQHHYNEWFNHHDTTPLQRRYHGSPPRGLLPKQTAHFAGTPPELSQQP